MIAATEGDARVVRVDVLNKGTPASGFESDQRRFHRPIMSCHTHTAVLLSAVHGHLLGRDLFCTSIYIVVPLSSIQTSSHQVCVVCCIYVVFKCKNVPISCLLSQYLLTSYSSSSTADSSRTGRLPWSLVRLSTPQNRVHH